MIVGALVLAAGLSSRMGAAKLALPLSGRPLLRSTLDAVAAAGLPPLLVTGGHREAVEAAAPDVARIHAEAHAQGLAESLKAGLAATPADWNAALIVLGDMPFVAPATLRALAAALAAGALAVVPVADGRRGNPAGFSRRVWPQLMQLQGDRGGRTLLDRIGVQEIAVEDPGIHRDIDLPQDLTSS